MSCVLKGRNIEIRRTLESDIQPIADNMRDADRVEVKASHGHLPNEALRQGLQVSHECYTAVLEDGTPAAMFGCCSTAYPHLGGVWFLASTEAEKLMYGRDFLTLPPVFFDNWHKKYQNLFNIVDKRNQTSLRWLKRLGFKTIAESSEWTTERTPFVMVLRSFGG